MFLFLQTHLKAHVQVGQELKHMTLWGTSNYNILSSFELPNGGKNSYLMFTALVELHSFMHLCDIGPSKVYWLM